MASNKSSFGDTLRSLRLRPLFSLRVPGVLLCVVVVLFGTAACKPTFTLNGSAIDYTVYRNIHVSQFPIRAALVYAPLQQTFENELQDYILRNTRLQITDGASDLQLEGEITGYTLTPQAVTADAYASKTRLTITVKIKYIDNKVEGKDVEQTFSAYRDFDASVMLNDVQDELCREISKELVELIFNSTLGNW